MSGTYIPNMKLPEYAYYRTIRIFADGTAIDMLSCQTYHAISIPDHGRLIDGDELAAGCDDPHWCRWLSEITDAPTIIPADNDEEV